MRRKQNCEIVFGFKSDTAVLTFTFRFLSSPLFSLLLPHFFSFAGHLVGFILVGKVFRKAFRILGLGERKGRWVVEQDFHGNFQVSVTTDDVTSSGREYMDTGSSGGEWVNTDTNVTCHGVLI